MTRATLMLILVVGLAACGDIGMDRQPRYGVQEAAVSLPHRAESQVAPGGVVAVGEPQREAEALTPPAVDIALVRRGRARFLIACAPCHGAQGAGDGAVVARGFPPPPSLSDARISKMDARRFYDVITNGYGIMAPQAERVAPKDRWAIIAYIRALELASARREAT